MDQNFTPAQQRAIRYSTCLITVLTLLACAVMLAVAGYMLASASAPTSPVQVVDTTVGINGAVRGSGGSLG